MEAAPDVWVPLAMFPPLHTATPPVFEQASFCFSAPASQFFGNTILEVLHHCKGYEALHHRHCVNRAPDVGMLLRSTNAEVHHIWKTTLGHLCTTSSGQSQVVSWVEQSLDATQLWSSWNALTPGDGVFVYRVTDLFYALKLASVMVAMFASVEWLAPVQSGFPVRSIYLMARGFGQSGLTYAEIYQRLSGPTDDRVHIRTTVRNGTLEFLHRWLEVNQRNIQRSEWIRQFVTKSGHGPLPIDPALFRKTAMALQYESQWMAHWAIVFALHQEYVP